MTTHRQNNLEQYRAVLTDSASVIDENTVPSIADARKKAAQRILSDSTKDADPIFAPDMGLNLNRLQFSTDIESVFKCGLPTISSLLGITVNDTFRPTDRLLKLLPEGVTVTSFANASPEASEIIRSHYATLTDGDEDGDVLLNTAFVQDGILVHVKAGVRLDRPIQLVNLLEPIDSNEGNTLPVLVFRRLLIVLEADAVADILVCDHSAANAASCASSRVNEIFLGNGACLRLYELEESGTLSGRYCRTVSTQGENSSLKIFSGTLRPGRSINRYLLNLDAPGAEAGLSGLAIVSEGQTSLNGTEVFHHAPHCTSNQNFKYLVDDDGRGSFEGLIRVDHGAAGTSAYQSDRNLLASPRARMYSQPQLEIYCDDVKCSHGAATGQLDERAMFYMRSRGIDLPEARSMLMNAFMADVIDDIELQPLRDRLKHLVELRLAGNTANCNGCDAC